MSKHTPGPWYQVGSWVAAAVEDDKRPDICTCNPAAMEQAHLKWDWETVHANARLIAAAPELLETLRLVAKLSYGSPHNHAIQERVRAVIAKVEGGDQ